MASTAAIVGIIILIIGLILGIYAVIYPVHPTVLSQSLSIDGNDYQSANMNMTAGEKSYIQVSITNNTIFTFDIMNRSQYYNFYGCAPTCHTIGNVTNPLSTLANVTVTPSSPATISFTAPSTGTYYFVFDNTIGPNYSCYTSSCYASISSPSDTYPTLGSFSVSGYAVNWSFLGAGVALLIIGGLIATVFWRSGRRMV